MNLFLLLGLAIVIIGFALKMDPIAIMVLSGLATGLLAGKSPQEVLEILGKGFLDQRLATLFVLTLPVIGVLERHGLREKAMDLISGVKSASTGRILMLYQTIRTLAAAASLRLSGHPQFIRPLILPMVEASTERRYGQLPQGERERMKGLSAASENFAGFFGQDVFLGSPGTMMIAATMVEQGYGMVEAKSVALWSLPIAFLSLIVSGVYFAWFDRKIAKEFGGEKKAKSKRGEQG